MREHFAPPGKMTFFDRSMVRFRDRKTSSKVWFVILGLLYIGLAIYIPRVGASQKVFTGFGKTMPFSSCTGVISSLMSVTLIFMLVFYGKIGYWTALTLSICQFPQQIVGIVRAPVLTGLPGIFSNLLIILTITVIYRNQRRTVIAQQKLQDQAVTDSLTGLPNRFACSVYLSRLVEKREPFVLVSIDLNNFKGINDMLGHRAGDQVLQAVAERWKDAAAAGGTGNPNAIGRIGGDEFELFIQGCSSEDEILETIGRFRAALEEPLTVSEIDYHLRASFGYVTFPMDATTPDSLVTYADIAMNKAKSSGGARTIVRFTRDLLSYEHELEIEQEIRSALEEDRVFYHLQPQFNIDHQLRGFEALARIRGKDGKLISPGDFIPVAEKTGLVSNIDSIVFRKAAAFFGDVVCKSGSDITLSVNISVQHMMKNNFISEVKSILAECRVPAEQIEIEITESIMIDSAENALRCLDEMKQLGLRIAIDDFGTGYSSLSYLNKMSADLLKVDKAFIDQMNATDSSRQYVAAIISIGHIMNLKVIAEGVEESDQMETLRKIGCDFIQGFIWGRPMPPEEAEKLVA